MCDIWKANSEKRELATEEIERHLGSFKKLNVREVVLSGGEPLMHDNLWKLCTMLRSRGIKVTLLSTGLLLKRYASEVLKNVDEVIVSLDGSKDVHNRIRNIPQAFEKLAEGVHAIQGVRVTGRCVLQSLNYRDFGNIIEAAKGIGLQQVSFLAADVSSAAFNHKGPAEGVALRLPEAKEFQQIIESSFGRFEGDYISKFIAESPEKMRKLAKYYLAMAGEGSFEASACNAPWVSAVLESDGRLMPCFFHNAYGNVSGKNFEQVLNSVEAIEFRRNLKVEKNEVCRKCVCSLKLSII
jgi:MoaA/NifB/PqqE/SkfB family radical SAM enzyme